MRVEAVRHNNGVNVWDAHVGELRARGVMFLMLTTFENELDGLLSALGNPRTPAVTEALLLRYSTVEEIHQELVAQMQRVELKMRMLGEGLVPSWADRETE